MPQILIRDILCVHCCVDSAQPRYWPTEQVAGNKIPPRFHIIAVMYLLLMPPLVATVRSVSALLGVAIVESYRPSLSSCKCINSHVVILYYVCFKFLFIIIINNVINNVMHFYLFRCYINECNLWLLFFYIYAYRQIEWVVRGCVRYVSVCHLSVLNFMYRQYEKKHWFKCLNVIIYVLFLYYKKMICRDYDGRYIVHLTPVPCQ